MPEAVRVRLGITDTSSSYTEVLEGLKEGELVATTGQTKLYEGAKVRLKDENPKLQPRHPKE
jgi:hypothetical protein